MEKAIELPPIRIRATLIFDDEIRVEECDYHPFIGPIHPSRVVRGPHYNPWWMPIENDFDPNEPLKLSSNTGEPR